MENTTETKRKDEAISQRETDLESRGCPSGGQLQEARVALRENPEQLARILAQAIEQSPVSVVVTDREACIEYVNTKFCQTTGYRAEEVWRQNPRMLKSGDQPPEFYAQMWQTLISGNPWYGEFLNRKKNGETYWERASISPIRSAAGEVTHYVAVKEDITEEKRISEELKTAKEAAEAANQAKSVFLANISHEIRTPMNAILGFSQLLLQDTALRAEQRKHLETILRSGEHLLKLINDVLEMSKIEAGRIILKPGVCELPRLLDDLGNMFQQRANSKGIQFEIVRHDELPRFIKTDEAKLAQVLINLLGNAIKFTPRGRVVMRVGLAKRNELVVEIEDTGPGIAEHELTQLFKPFSQTQAGILAKGGTGLGLAISREFIRLMGGEITVTSKVDQGSVFRFTIQFRESGVPRARARRLTPQTIRVHPGQEEYRVLIADDNETNRELISTMLSRVGFKIDAAADGLKAIQSFESFHPHLILMDMLMPVIDGCEVVRRIKSTPEGRRIPIIVVTANAFEEDRQAALRAGADDYLRKPFKADELFQKLSVHLAVEFVYGNQAREVPGRAAKPRIDSAVSPRVVFPNELVAKLRRAIRRGDIDQLERLLQEMAGYDAQVTEELRSFAHDFEYERMMTLLETIAIS